MAYNAINMAVMLQILSTDLSCCFGCMLALSVTHSPTAAVVCGLWHYVSIMPLL